MITAKEARTTLLSRVGQQQRMELFHLKTQADESIKSAVNKGLVQTTITLSQDIDPTLVNAFKRVLEKMGYRVSLKHVEGSFESNLYVAPASTMTINWER